VEEAVAKDDMLLSVPLTHRGVGPTAVDLLLPGHSRLWVTMETHRHATALLTELRSGEPVSLAIGHTRRPPPRLPPRAPYTPAARQLRMPIAHPACWTAGA
jgi:hypothetical protein